MSRILRDSTGKAASGIMLPTKEIVLFDDFKKNQEQYLDAYIRIQQKVLSSIGFKIAEQSEKQVSPP